MEYPESMFVAQRQFFLKRMAEIEMGIGGKGAGTRAAGRTTPPAQSPAISTFMETALLIAIVAEASLMTYFYRGKLADFFQALTTVSRVKETVPPSALPTSVEIQGVSPSPAISSTAVTASPTGTPGLSTNTSIPGIVGNNSSTAPGIDSTPVPNGNNNGNNGHHYGQTPKPERTKENNGNNSKPTKDKPPKEKPTKSK